MQIKKKNNKKSPHNNRDLNKNGTWPNFRSSLFSQLPQPAALHSSPRKPDSSISLISYIARSRILTEYGNNEDNNSAHTS